MGMKVKVKLAGDQAKVKLLIRHPMETGRRKDDSGKIIPAKYIQTLTCHANDELCFESQFGTGVSKDPFLSFTLLNRKAGDKLKFKWVDSTGDSDEKEVVIK